MQNTSKQNIDLLYKKSLVSLKSAIHLEMTLHSDFQPLYYYVSSKKKIFPRPSAFNFFNKYNNMF